MYIDEVFLCKENQNGVGTAKRAQQKEARKPWRKWNLCSSQPGCNLKF